MTSAVDNDGITQYLLYFVFALIYHGHFYFFFSSHRRG